MLLIQSDFMKSLWFTVYPIVSLTRKDRISSNSAFCQASGFFLALGIESSDVAVLLIAIHSALYFVYPRRAGGGKGLYPYRHFAYAFYVIVPLLMASLAFVKGSPGYVDTGAFCYLPTHPKWSRMALSWIPRYVNFIILIAIYSWIYIYVRLLMRRYSRRSSSAMVTTADIHEQELTVPRSQTLDRHGLILKPQGSHYQSNQGAGKLHCLCRRTRRTRSALKYGMKRMGGHDDDKSGPWRVPNFQQEPSTSEREAPEIPPESLRHPSPIIEPLAPIHPKRHPIRASIESEILPESFGTSIRGVFGMSRRGTRRITESEDAGCSCALLPLSTDALDPDGIVRNRDKIRRQLRLLFLYPLVYMLVWILPFISDIKRYQDALNGRGPFSLRLAFLISLCIQGLADSIVFALRERPWRYARGGLWSDVGARMRLGLKLGRQTNPGRTRDEMFDEARIARQRRDGEAQHEQRTARRTTGAAASSLRQGGRQNWWDRELRDSSDWSDDDEDETGMVDWGNGLKGSGIPAAQRT